MKKYILCCFAILLLLSLAGCGTSVSGDRLADTYEPALPDTYYIEIQVVNSSKFGQEETTYIISEESGWRYLQLGYEREQYVYMPIGEGKYIEYKYDTEKKAFLPTMISEALQEQIDKGNVPLDSIATSQESVNAKRQIVENFLFSYQNLTAALTYEADETVNGITCHRYAGKLKVTGTTSVLEFVIDPQTGVVLRSSNATKALIVTTRQETECVCFETTARIPNVE